MLLWRSHQCPSRSRPSRSLRPLQWRRYRPKQQPMLLQFLRPVVWLEFRFRPVSRCSLRISRRTCRSWPSRATDPRGERMKGRPMPRSPDLPSMPSKPQRNSVNITPVIPSGAIQRLQWNYSNTMAAMLSQSRAATDSAPPQPAGPTASYGPLVQSAGL